MLCRKCRIDKSRDEFNTSSQQKRGFQSYCRACSNQISATFHREHPGRTRGKKRKSQRKAQQWIQGHFQGHPCVDCGESDPVVLEFDHVRGQKISNVCDLARRRPYDLKGLMDEIGKCDVRCANCHRRKTVKERLTTSATPDTEDTCLLPLTFET